MEPSKRFNIYEALVSDQLHELGGLYKHLLEYVELMVLEKHGNEALNTIKERWGFFKLTMLNGQLSDQVNFLN